MFTNIYVHKSAFLTFLSIIKILWKFLVNVESQGKNNDN